LVGTGSDIAAGGLKSGIWQHADQTYSFPPGFVFTGADSPTTLGTATGTCNNWMTPSGQVLLGLSNYIDQWWATPSAVGSLGMCTGAGVYCVQTAP